MFGYITIDKSEMLVKDYEAYKAIYCTLCKQLGKDYSVFSRFILNYDCTFYALTALALSDDCPGLSSSRCRFNPFKKCNYLKNDSKALSMATALTVVTFYYKLVDNIADGSFFEKLFCYIILPFASSWKKLAKKKYPEIDAIVKEMSDSQFEVEKDEQCLIDKAAEPTALMLARVMELLEDDPQKRRVHHNFGYFLGKWIYLLDAVNDFESDKKHKLFNPYIIKYGDSKKEHIDEIRQSLDNCLSEALLSYRLMDIKRFDRIMENVLYYGLTKRQKEVLENKEK